MERIQIGRGSSLEVLEKTFTVWEMPVFISLFIRFLSSNSRVLRESSSTTSNAAQHNTSKEAESLITRVGPSLGCGDHTYGARFPKGRQDVCAVRRMAENGSSYGYDTLYLVWKSASGRLQHCEIVNSRSTKDYVDIDAITAEGDIITVSYSSGGSYSGNAWKGTKTICIA